MHKIFNEELRFETQYDTQALMKQLKETPPF